MDSKKKDKIQKLGHQDPSSSEVVKTIDEEGNAFRKEILQYIPNKDDKEKASLIIASLEERYSGPIPHPNHLAAYEQCCPGMADRIMRLAENQQAHRIDIEKYGVKESYKANSRGQLFGFIVTILFLIASIFVMSSVNNIVGLIMFSITAILLFTLYIGGKTKIHADLKNKSISGETEKPTNKEKN